jgi:hypothetical protein
MGCGYPGVIVVDEESCIDGPGSWRNCKKRVGREFQWEMIICVLLHRAFQIRHKMLLQGCCKVFVALSSRRHAAYIFCLFVDALKGTLMRSVVKVPVFYSNRCILSAAFFSL